MQCDAKDAGIYMVLLYCSSSPKFNKSSSVNAS